MWRFAAVGFVAVLFLLCGKLRDPFVLSVFALALTMLVSTIVCDGKKMDWLYDWATYVAAVLLTVTVCRLRPRELLLGVLLIVSIMSLVNVASMVLYPGGVYEPQVYFYGNRNIAYQLSFLAVSSSLLADRLSGGRAFMARSLLVLALSVLQVILAHSTTTYIASLVYAIALVCIVWRVGRRMLNGFTALAASIAAFLLVVVFRVTNWFEPFITSVLHKSITLSGRGPIWDVVFSFFDADHVLFGYGVSGNDLIYVGVTHYNHAHNMYLDVWFQGGLIGLLLFFVILILAANALFAHRSDLSSGVLSAALCAYFVVGVTEPMMRVSFLLVISLAYCVSSVIKDSRLRTDENHADGRSICADGEEDYNGSVRLLTK